MTWKDVTVKQFQDIHRLSMTDMDEMEKLERILSIVYNLTDEQVGNMPVKEFNEAAKNCSFLLTDDIPGKCVKVIKVNNKKYAIEYAPHKLRHRQYIEVLHYSDKPIENMHLIMASIVQPVKFGFKQKNNVEHHRAMAMDMLDARMIDVYHSCVFFCKLYASLIRAIRSYLEMEMIQKGLTKEEAQTLLDSSISVMDGFIPQKKWQNLKG